MTLRLVLHECAAGFGLFKREEVEELALKDPAVQASLKDFSRFSRQVSLHAWHPFTSAVDALDACNSISEGALPSSLAAFLESSITAKSKSKAILGVSCPKLASAIQEHVGIKCECNSNVEELIRLIRGFVPKYVETVSETDLKRAQVGLGTAYSRSKLMYNVNRNDNMIIQAIAVVDSLDKYVNQSAMRVREWYSYHFPELAKLISDHQTYARAVFYLGRRARSEEWTVEGIVNACAAAGTADVTEELAQKIIDMAKVSAGIHLSELDAINIEALSSRMVKLSAYRDQMKKYLESKVGSVCPSLGELLSPTVAARLISHSGSLIALAKAPASTIQILGAEKSLFRALKTRQPTPKYGIIFHCTQIGKAARAHKGKMARTIATKAAMAARIDAFSDSTTPVWGRALRRLADDRLAYYETGGTFEPNEDAMERAFKEVAEATAGAAAGATEEKVEKKDDKKDKKKAEKRERESAEKEPTEKRRRKEKA